MSNTKQKPLQSERVLISINSKLLERLSDHCGSYRRSPWIREAIEEKLAREEAAAKYPARYPSKFADAS